MSFAPPPGHAEGSVTPSARRYYGGRRGLEDALDTLKGRGCGFVVAGRLDKQNSFVQTDQAISGAPDSYRDMFLEMPHFRHDISSTELRAKEALAAAAAQQSA